MKVETILGCYGQDRPLLTRWHLLDTPWFRLYLHLFHRSDEDRELHDHPWSFVSLILWGGYQEMRPIRRERNRLEHHEKTKGAVGKLDRDMTARFLSNHDALKERRRYRPGSLLYRPAWWAHRVELPPGRKALTLVVVGKKARDWGFFTKDGWRFWRKFVTSRDCG